MGLAYTIDTPLKVARFGINSVVSIVEDNLLEHMRKFYCSKENEEYIPIKQADTDSRARRITAYLNLLKKIVERQVLKLKAEEFIGGNEIEKYFEMLPSSASLKHSFLRMKALKEGTEKASLQTFLRNEIVAGDIDVNIMTKIDRKAYSKTGDLLPSEYSDALAALRGYANSQLNSSVIFSAGMNPRLYTYCESFKDFYPDENEMLKKKIILKVSDFRSALIQGKFLAKKGLWVSEFRIESGLNCGGHAFATDGYLLGPILEEFRTKRDELSGELMEICNTALKEKGLQVFTKKPPFKLSVQGGIGTANENDFLIKHYNIDSTGWGSPFLLVPEATNVDDDTLRQLLSAKKEDYFLSNSSPLGVLFNNFRKSSANEERIERIKQEKPGSPCHNKYLSFNTEFTDKPICIASKQYQSLKIKQLKSQPLTPEELENEIEKVTEKECICQGLGTAAFLKNGLKPPFNSKTVSICPGPNLMFFSNTCSLKEMTDHIYGRKNILTTENRPHMFINELNLYVDYLKKEIGASLSSITEKQNKYLSTFKENLIKGIEYYKPVIDTMKRESDDCRERFLNALISIDNYLKTLHIPEPVV